MVDDAAIGVPGTHPVSLSEDEQTRLAGAVRETRKRASLMLIRPYDRPDLLFCPSCGERVILLDQPETFVVRDAERMCAACGAERDFVQLYRSEADIGGEGGG